MEVYLIILGLVVILYALSNFIDYIAELLGWSSEDNNNDDWLDNV